MSPSAQSHGTVTVHVAGGLEEPAIIANLLHELCHFAAMPTAVTPVALVDASTPPPSKPLTLAHAVIFANKRHAADLREPGQMPAAFWNHCDSFCRLASHAWWRANRLAGFFLRPGWLGFAGEYPSLSAMSSPEKVRRNSAR